jgi:predicted HTH domain antitoxin
MSITFTLPDGIERHLRQEVSDLDQTAKEAVVVELYRQGKLSHGELAESLRVSRYEVDALLKRHNVIEDLLTLDEFKEQAKVLRTLLRE